MIERRALLLSLPFSIVIASAVMMSSAAIADIYVQYTFDEQERAGGSGMVTDFTNGSVTPLSNAFVKSIQHDVLFGAGQPAEWSTGVYTDIRFPFNPETATEISNLSIVLNGEPIACPGDPADCTGQISYETEVPQVTNSILLRFANGSEGGGLPSIGAGEIEVVALNWQNRLRTGESQDSLIVVTGVFSFRLSGSIGQLTGTGNVDSWNNELSGFQHSEVMCYGGEAFCGLDLNTDGTCYERHDLVFESPPPLIPAELIVTHEEIPNGGPIPMEIALEGDDPEECVVALVDGECPEVSTVPGSIDMTFSNGNADVAFEIFQRCTGAPGNFRQYYHFEGTNGAVVPEAEVPALIAEMLPEPGIGLLHAGAVTTLGAVSRVRRRGRRATRS